MNQKFRIILNFRGRSMPDLISKTKWTTTTKIYAVVSRGRIFGVIR